jgi:biotin carboxyl carrier protein
MGLDERKPADRLADHAAIDSLADDLIPALIAKLGASGLGEIEVREGDWKVRLRRPAEGAVQGSGRRSGERSVRAGSATVAPAGRSALTPVGPGRGAGAPEEADGRSAVEAPDVGTQGAGEGATRVRDPFRAMATAPAVGFYQPRSGVVPGSRVRAGDPIGAIDVLGIPTEVVAPADGIVGASLVEPGEAVEYGQELVWVELLSTAPAGSNAPGGVGGNDPGAPGEP